MVAIFPHLVLLTEFISLFPLTNMLLLFNSAFKWRWYQYLVMDKISPF